MRTSLALALAAALTTLAGCAATSRGDTAPRLSAGLAAELPASLSVLPATAGPAVGGLSSGLSTMQADVLVPMHDRTVYDLIERRWPTVLRPMTPNARSGPRGDVVGVYANGVFIGGVETLQTVYARDLLAVHRLSASEEFMKYGHSHPGGGVVLVWRTGRQ
jgi:hypothetical protein